MTPAWITPLLLLATVQSHLGNIPRGVVHVDRLIAAHPLLRDRRACVSHVRSRFSIMGIALWLTLALSSELFLAPTAQAVETSQRYPIPACEEWTHRYYADCFVPSFDEANPQRRDAINVACAELVEAARATCPMVGDLVGADTQERWAEWLQIQRVHGEAAPSVGMWAARGSPQGGRHSCRPDRSSSCGSRVTETSPGLKRTTRAHAALRDQSACVARVREALPESKRTEHVLATAALAACVPSDPWVRVFTGEPPRTARRPGSTYVDRSRLVVTDGQRVRFWVLVEHFDEDFDFYLAQCVLDCSSGQTRTLLETTVSGGRTGTLEGAKVRWKDARESYQGIEVTRFVCHGTDLAFHLRNGPQGADDAG